MGINILWNSGEIRDLSQLGKVLRQKQITEFLANKVFKTLSYVGESFVKKARGIDTYLDQTGNLRSSIGYIILHNGKTVTSNFKLSKKGTDKVTGKDAAENYAKNVVAAKYPTGWVLIGVAGMEYSVDVESLKIDVITASSVESREQMQRLLQKLVK